MQKAVTIAPSRLGTTHSTTLDMSMKSTMMKRSLNILTFLLASSMGAALAALPSAPTGICIEHAEGVECAAANPATATSSSGQAGVFPGTNLKFRPGIVVWTGENESPSVIESKWQALFTSSPNRKESYRPTGVYGGVAAALAWSRFYTSTNVRPTDPTDHEDPGYDWSLLDAIFNINAVKNEGALVVLKVSEIGWGSRRAPNWIANAPYNGLFDAGPGGESGSSRETLKYYRYAGPDFRSPPQSNVTASSGAPIVEELVYFYRALHDHLVAAGNIDKVMTVQLGEAFVNATTLPSDYDFTDLQHGIGVRNHKIAEIFAESQIPVLMSSMVGPSASTWWKYMDNPTLGLTFPDMKMTGTGNGGINGGTRFTDPTGATQENTRPLSQSTETNGLRATTYFAPGVPNPWGYSGVTVPQTPSHVLWALSGPPKGESKDSGLGQAGEDPPGLMPVHIILVQWGATWDSLSPSVSDWHKAIDTFGPPGTFAFPYLPPGYEPSGN